MEQDTDGSDTAWVNRAAAAADHSATCASSTSARSSPGRWRPRYLVTSVLMSSRWSVRAASGCGLGASSTAARTTRRTHSSPSTGTSAASLPTSRTLPPAIGSSLSAQRRTSWSRTSGPARWTGSGSGTRPFGRSIRQIVYASSSGYGQSGPYATRPGQDMLIQALSGIMFLAGREGEPPTACGIGVADQYTGLHNVIGILAALLHRDQAGIGQRVELDLLSCTIAAQQQELTYYFNHGSIPERPAQNVGSIFSTAPFGIYETADGHVAIAMTPCPVLATALELEWLAEFDTLDKMARHHYEIYEGLARHLVTDTTDRWVRTLLDHDVWCAPVQDYAQVVRDPQVLHNGDVLGRARRRWRADVSHARFTLQVLRDAGRRDEGRAASRAAHGRHSRGRLAGRVRRLGRRRTASSVGSCLSRRPERALRPHRARRG